MCGGCAPSARCPCGFYRVSYVLAVTGGNLGNHLTGSVVSRIAVTTIRADLLTADVQFCRAINFRRPVVRQDIDRRESRQLLHGFLAETGLPKRFDVFIKPLFSAFSPESRLPVAAEARSSIEHI